MADCVICLETAASIACSHCSTTTHPTCIQAHLLNTVLEPHCPNCLKPWSHTFLAEYLPKTWRLTTYKSYRESILLDRQKSLLPATQEAALAQENERKMRAVRAAKADDLKAINREYRRAKDALADVRREHKHKKTHPDIEEKKVALARVIERQHAAELELQAIVQGQFDIRTGQITDHAVAAPIVDKVRREFIQPCPAAECRGFLSTAWKCKLCSARVCPKCGDLITTEPDDHECDPGTLASFTLIRSDSKGCPKCGVPITKISGCDHMFCVDCKTSFSWRTMEIHPDGNSNPHYRQWRQANPGAAAAPPPPGAPCDGRDRLYTIESRIARMYNVNGFHQLLRSLSHLQGYMLPYHRTAAERDEQQERRVKYLLKEITQEEWQVSIQRVDKKQRKAQFIVDILDLFILGSIDILGSFNNASDEQRTIQAIEELRTLCNSELNKIAVIFGSTVYQIYEDFNFSSEAEHARMLRASKSAEPEVRMRHTRRILPPATFYPSFQLPAPVFELPLP